ncbi:MAG: transporter substrate-binding domain-containing protein [Anaerolineae bacterium]
MKKLTSAVLVFSLLALLFALAPTATHAQAAVACQEDVTVQADDWLSKYADKFYGDPLAFPAIFEATNAAAAADSSYATIENPDLIEIGWKVCIPSASEAQAILVRLGAESAATDDLLAEIMARGTIRVSTDPNYAPQSFLEADGTFVGFDIDVAREIASRLGVEVEFVTPDWDLITAGNWGDQWDISVGSMTVTSARQKVLWFAQPSYYYTPAQFAAANDSGIETLDDIAGQTVCVGVSTTYESWLNGDLAGLGLPPESFFAEIPADVTVFPLSTDNECVQSIQAGRTEFSVVLTSNTVVEAAMAEGAPIHKVGSPVFSENLAVSVDKNHSKDPLRLVSEVSRVVGEMHADGTLSELSMKWFGEDLTTDPTK